jgi:hypothetical protein
MTLMRGAAADSDPCLDVLLEKLQILAGVGGMRERLAGAVRPEVWTDLVAKRLAPYASGRPRLVAVLGALGLLG